jgi:glycosyltransferase involved in cell wall biosynthesis
VVNPKKCSQCIKVGRKNPLARINEELVNFHIGEFILSSIEKSNFLNRYFHSRSIVTRSALKRATKHQERLKSVLSKLDHIVTPSEFGKFFFSQFGVQDYRITRLTWPYDKLGEKLDIPSNDLFTITFIGRVSPDKGVHLIFEALENLSNLTPICLRVLGVNNSEYCVNLQNKYPNWVKQHQVEWVSWTDDIHSYLASTDALIIPSVVMDNTPLILIEAIAYKVPIIAPSIPSISEYLENGVGYVFNFNDSVSLSKIIQTAYLEIRKNRTRNILFPNILSVNKYANELIKIYQLIYNKV